MCSVVPHVSTLRYYKRLDITLYTTCWTSMGSIMLFPWALVIFILGDQMQKTQVRKKFSKSERTCGGIGKKKSRFKGLPICLRPFRLYFSIIFGILLFSVLVTCRRQFDLYLLRYSSTGSTFNSSKISSFLLWSRRAYLAVLLKASSWLISIVFIFFSKAPNFDSI